MTDKYILGGDDGHTPIPVDDLLEWAQWMEAGNRQVASDRIGHLLVSTVFLGLDHSFRFLRGGSGPPVVFETMVFAIHDAGPHAGDMERCSTWDEAVAQHEQVVARLKERLLPAGTTLAEVPADWKGLTPSEARELQWQEWLTENAQLRLGQPLPELPLATARDRYGWRSLPNGSSYHPGK